MAPNYRLLGRTPRQRRPSQPLVLNNFRFGLNTALSQASIRQDEASSLVNFKILPSGVLQIREGLTRYTSSALPDPASHIQNFTFNLDLSQFAIFEDTDDREWTNAANREWQVKIPASSGFDELIVTKPDNKLYRLTEGKAPSLITTLEGEATIIPAGDRAFICDSSYLKYWDKTSASVLMAYDDGTGANGYQHTGLTLTADTHLKLYSGNNTRSGIKFTTQHWDSGYTITATKVEVYVRKVGSPTGSVGCEIYTSAGALFVTSTTTYEAADIGTTAEKLSFIYASGAFAPSTAYWAVVTFSGGGGLSAEKVTDGVFAGAGDWTWGAGWAHDGGSSEADATASNADLEQDVTAVAGESYKLVFTVKNYSAGSVLPKLGGTDGTSVSADATYTQYIHSITTGNLIFDATGFTGSIDDVSVKKVVDYIQVEYDTTTADGNGKYYDGSWHDDSFKLGLVGVKPGRPPRGMFGLIQNTRLYTAGDPLQKGVVWYSNVNAAFDWSTADGGGYIGAIDQTLSNFSVGALISIYGGVYIFGQQSQPYLCKLLGSSPSEYSLPPILQKVYTTHKTVLYTGNDVWFGSEIGVNALSGVQQYGDLRTFTESDAIVDRINDYWNDSEAISGYFGETGQYFLKLPGYGRCLVAHTKQPVQDARGQVKHPWTEYVFIKEDLSLATCTWVASGKGTNEYYLELASSISKPAYLLFQDSIISEGVTGSLSDHEWSHGDNDSLGYDTVYIRDDSGDPDTTGVKIKSVLEPTAFANYDNTFFVACDDGYIYKMDNTVEEDNSVEIPYVVGTKLFESPFNEICLEKYDVSCATSSSLVTLDLEIYTGQTMIDTLHSSTADVIYTISVGSEYDRNLNANYNGFMAVLRNINPDSQELQVNNIVLVTRTFNV
ncbi:MAG: hypothetical protein JRI41_02950 [Deltaproteobacteria bacterium]|nr:hypothetical protein [Deltaproteobacteria bacterium]